MCMIIGILVCISVILNFEIRQTVTFGFLVVFHSTANQTLHTAKYTDGY